MYKCTHTEPVFVLPGADLPLCRLHTHASEVILRHTQEAEVSSGDPTQVREDTVCTSVQ